ncbi:MAG: LysR substrate-binding domain-containing protein [Amphritea sp.]|nr:LysR substrate-binding domain-containing protein [Amphritea sp.]
MVQKALPPLRALIAFEATVRHSSFKLAAEELHVTPGAVAQQVQKLEEWLGFRLFNRQVRQLQITDRGLGYYSQIAPSLEQIGRVSESYRCSSSDSVHLYVSQTLAAKWLSPRLADFIRRYPDFEVHVSASNVPVDFRREQTDLALRHLAQPDPSLICEQVNEDRCGVFCTPDYQQRMDLNEPEQLARTTLIVASLYPYWNAWLSEFTAIDSDSRADITRLNFDQALLAIDAARRGQGVVLSNALLVEEELESGELVEPFRLRLDVAKGYYLVHPANQPLSDAAMALKSWLLDQFAGR